MIDSNEELQKFLNEALTHLRLREDYVNASTLQLISKESPNLRIIDFFYLRNSISPTDYSNFLSSLTQLQAITLHCCEGIDDQIVSSLTKKSDLVKLNLDNCQAISKESWLTLSKSFKNLRFLFLYSFSLF